MDCIPLTVIIDMNESLTTRVMVEDIKALAHQMRGLKASGLDNFQGVFYHTFWENIVVEFNELVGYSVWERLP